MHLDVTDEAMVKAAAQGIDEEFGRLDVLVNNAGIWLDKTGRPGEVTPAVVRETFETNVFGVVAVTQAMLPLLQRSRAGRIVNMSSPLGSLGLMADHKNEEAGPRLLAYNSSKAALNALTFIYANELRAVGIRVNAVSPGFVATDLNDLRWRGLD